MKQFVNHLFLAKEAARGAAQRVESTAGSLRLPVRIRTLLLSMAVAVVFLVSVVVVLLHLVLDDAAHNGPADCSENAVVGLVASESSSKTSGDCATKTSFTVLSFAGRTLFMAVILLE